MVAVSLFTLGSLACALSGLLSGLVTFFASYKGVSGGSDDDQPVARLACDYPRSELLPVLNFVTMPETGRVDSGAGIRRRTGDWASWRWIF